MIPVLDYSINHASILCLVSETIVNFTAGEESPTDGSAYIFGKNIRSNPKAARQHVCCDFYLGYSNY